MSISLRQLQYVVTVADTERFGLAAKKLNVAQPSLSAQIAECEAELGLRIFDRGRNGAQVTPLGQDVVRRARTILREMDDLMISAKGRRPFDGQLRLGVLPSIGPYILPNVVRRLHQDHPNLRLVLKDENTSALEAGLRDGELDLIISTPQDHPNTLQTPLFSERFWIAFALDDPLADMTGPVGMTDLKDKILLTLDRSHRLSRIVHDLASDCGASISADYTGSSLDTIRLMAATGVGVAILPEIYTAAVGVHSRDIALRPLNLPQAGRDLALIQKRRQQPIFGSDILAAALIDEAAAILVA
ncbi:LysR substrate-binding domain-containing protein [Coralliovum pocilloporae]|uniref:LysR substrate-binding domain-containing protein n=1 Tax=Coralliovum pocilloporae TaxID=3066369 RepID=UPI00330746A8